MSDWLKMAFTAVCCLLGAGLIILISSKPRGNPVTLYPPPTEAPLIIHIVGAVAHPGVYSLPPESRLQDAITAAGGLIAEADVEYLNLAAFVQDGVQVIVPTKKLKNEASPTLPVSVRQSGEISLVNINQASQAELEALPAIGEVYAQNIITYRMTNGPFLKIEDILNVDGIGIKAYERIKNLITISDSP